MNIVYASDNNFAEILGISIISLFENNKQCKEINVFILDDGITDDNRQRLLSVGSGFDRKIEFIPVSDIEIPQSVQSERWSRSAFTRLFLRKLLPEGADRILYLDCDTIIRGELTEVYETDMEDCTVAGVRDCVSPMYLKNLWLERDDIYCNSGVLLILTEKWNEEEFMHFFRSNRSIKYPDQDIINGVCSRNMKELPLRYNCYTALYDFSYSELIKYRKPSEYYTEKETAEAVSDPVIVHFTTSFLSLRPWVEGSRHPYAGEWSRYKAMSPWAEAPLRKDNRSAIKRLAVKIFKAMPRSLSVSIAGVLHAYLVPMLRRKGK